MRQKILGPTFLFPESEFGFQVAGVANISKPHRSVQQALIVNAGLRSVHERTMLTLTWQRAVSVCVVLMPIGLRLLLFYVERTDTF